jgi:hypothetical protein
VVKLTQTILDQVARYNIPLQVPYLMITNGLQHYCFKIQYQSHSVEILATIPEYEEIAG